MTFPKWDDLSELEQAQCIYSDTHKDRYGFRPRPSQDKWNDLEWLNAEIEYLYSLPREDDPGLFPSKESLGG